MCGVTILWLDFGWTLDAEEGAFCTEDGGFQIAGTGAGVYIMQVTRSFLWEWSGGFLFVGIIMLILFLCKLCSC